MNIPLAIAVSIVPGELNWKSLVSWWKTVNLSFCLIVPSGYAKHADSGRIEKENTLSKSMAFVPLVTWSSATFFDFFFFKLSLAKVVMVVLQIGSMNYSDVQLHSDTNTSLFSSSHLNKSKHWFCTFFDACLFILMWCRIKNLC